MTVYPSYPPLLTHHTRIQEPQSKGMGHLQSCEVALEVASHKHDDLIGQGLRAVPSSDLQDAPACGFNGVIVEAVGVPILVQYPLDFHCLRFREPVCSCTVDSCGKREP